MLGLYLTEIQIQTMENCCVYVFLFLFTVINPVGAVWPGRVCCQLPLSPQCQSSCDRVSTVYIIRSMPPPPLDTDNHPIVKFIMDIIHSQPWPPPICSLPDCYYSSIYYPAQILCIPDPSVFLPLSLHASFYFFQLVYAYLPLGKLTSYQATCPAPVA